MAKAIPPRERLITIEDTDELALDEEPGVVGRRIRQRRAWVDAACQCSAAVRLPVRQERSVVKGR